MKLQLNCIRPSIRRKKLLRIGRGIGSGKGKTSGRGHKGQSSRSGYSSKSGFEGGQTPFHRRIPKFGFRSHRKLVRCSINLNKTTNFSWLSERPVNILVEVLGLLRKNNRIVKLYGLKEPKT